MDGVRDTWVCEGFEEEEAERSAKAGILKSCPC